MKALLIPMAMAGLGLAGGMGAAYVLAPPPEVEETESEQPDPEEEEKEAATGPVEFARLNNQFIVPVVEDGAVSAMVVLSLTLEVDEGGTESVFANEPRLRDRFLRVLFDHANIGGFDVGFTQNGTMTLLRTALMETANKTLGKIVRDVLIVDIVRQEV